MRIEYRYDIMLPIMKSFLLEALGESNRDKRDGSIKLAISLIDDVTHWAEHIKAMNEEREKDIDSLRIEIQKAEEIEDEFDRYLRKSQLLLEITKEIKKES